MTMIRYSDEDRERIRRDKEARQEEWRREELYMQFLCENGYMTIADRRPVSEELIQKIGSLDLRWRDRKTQRER
jgi:hypothetical protein